MQNSLLCLDVITVETNAEEFHHQTSAGFHLNKGQLKVSESFCSSGDETLQTFDIGFKRCFSEVRISGCMHADTNIVTIKENKRRSFQQDSAHSNKSHYSVRYRAHEWQSVLYIMSLTMTFKGSSWRLAQRERLLLTLLHLCRVLFDWKQNNFLKWLWLNHLCPAEVF